MPFGNEEDIRATEPRPRRFLREFDGIYSFNILPVMARDMRIRDAVVRRTPAYH